MDALQKQLAAFTQKAEELEYEKTLAQQIAGGSGPGELKGMISEFINEVSKVTTPEGEEKPAEITMETEADQVQAVLDALKAKIRQGVGCVNGATLDSELAKAKSQSDAALAAAAAKHKEEADKLQELNEQVGLLPFFRDRMVRPSTATHREDAGCTTGATAVSMRCAHSGVAWHADRPRGSARSSLVWLVKRSQIPLNPKAAYSIAKLNWF